MVGDGGGCLCSCAATVRFALVYGLQIGASFALLLLTESWEAGGAIGGAGAMDADALPPYFAA